MTDREPKQVTVIAEQFLGLDQGFVPSQVVELRDESGRVVHRYGRYLPLGRSETE